MLELRDNLTIYDAAYVALAEILDVPLLTANSRLARATDPVVPSTVERRPTRSPLGDRPSLPCMRAVQLTRFGGPEVLEIVDVPEPTPGEGQQLYDVSTAGVNFADTHHWPSGNLHRRGGRQRGYAVL